VDDRPEPQRIEIELTANEPSGPGRHRPRQHLPEGASPVSSEAPDSVAPRQRLLESERGRLVTGVSVVGVAALVLGVFLGRLGSSNEVATVEPTTTTIGSTTTVRTTVVNTLPRVQPQAPTEPPQTVAVPVDDPDVPVVGSIELVPGRAAVADEVVALTRGGRIIRIDGVTGSTVTYSVQGSNFGPETLFAGDGWILVPGFDLEAGSVVIHDDGSRTSIDIDSGYPLLFSRGSESLWLWNQDGSGGPPSALVEVGLDGEPTGSLIELRSYPRMMDPLGDGVVVDAPGGSYVLTSAGASKLTSGRLVALGRTVAFVQECDDQLRCDYSVLDRATGERRILTLDPSFDEGTEIDAGGWWTMIDPVDHADDRVLVSAWEQSGNQGNRQGVLDLVTGSFTEIARNIDIPGMYWTSDDQSVIWIDRGTIMVFDVATGENRALSNDVSDVVAVAVRPLGSPFAAQSP
jgi:hypothetical protein